MQDAELKNQASVVVFNVIETSFSASAVAPATRHHGVLRITRFGVILRTPSRHQNTGQRSTATLREQERMGLPSANWGFARTKSVSGPIDAKRSHRRRPVLDTERTDGKSGFGSPHRYHRGA